MNLDFSKDELLDKALLVPIQDTPCEPLPESSRDLEIFKNSAAIDYCLSPDSIIECMKRLKKFKPTEDDQSNWTTEIVQALETLDSNTVEVLTQFYYII